MTIDRVKLVSTSPNYSTIPIGLLSLDYVTIPIFENADPSERDVRSVLRVDPPNHPETVSISSAGGEPGGRSYSGHSAYHPIVVATHILPLLLVQALYTETPLPQLLSRHQLVPDCKNITKASKSSLHSTPYYSPLHLHWGLRPHQLPASHSLTNRMAISRGDWS